ncbi:MAG: GGDEF domain-containing protein [Oscillospiraceae bacterium]|nr:GGDEF domain-containing protein [Oscillospiraceae bacterium]
MNDIVFEWDILSDNVVFSGCYEKLFGCLPATQNFPRSFLQNGTVRAGDGAILLDLCSRIQSGACYAEAELRIQDTNQNPVWCRVRMSAVQNNAGQAIKAVGIISDISAQKQKEYTMQEMATKDFLTQLFNRRACQQLVPQKLSQTQIDGAALMILDVDNFKSINDTCGHLAGDEVLRQIANRLTEIFYDNSILGRIGGDEFIIFIEQLGEDTLQQIEQYAQTVLEALGEIEASGNGQTCPVTASIGIACSPAHGVSYNTLFAKADAALYTVKGQGKNAWALFAETEDMIEQAKRHIMVANL